MLPLTFANIDEDCIIRKVNGSPEVKKHLENLGFVEGGTVSIISKTEGNLIVNVKGARVALNKEMASKIMI
ncbi:MAG: FeoA family protein [Anaerovoracaceae bacterium]